MTTKMPSLRNFRNPIGCLFLLAAFAAAAGCSTAETPGGSGTNMNHVLPSGSSVSGWVVTPSGGTHASTATLDYIANNGSSGCTQCHGSDLSGGISGVSCFGNTAGCHHGPVTGWVATAPAAQQHGVSAKKAPGSSGFASCQICHGSNFSGGGSNVSCYICHPLTPHARRPWRASAGSLYDHGTTDTANASVCYTCHAYTGTANPNNPHPPTSPALPGTAPGCFNGTMCHNQAGHPPGWTATAPAPQPHGDTAKKDGTVSGQGFPSCQECHGANFAGGSVNVSCFLCHGVSAPHARKPWRASAGTAYTHTTTVEAGNVPVCYTCHAYTGTANPRNPHPPPTPAPANTPPGCFNGTMCHNQALPHPVPFNDPVHDNTTSLSYAGTTYPGCISCHDISAPSTKAGPVCQTCHVAASPLAAANCTSCHGSPPNSGAPAGAAYPNIAGAHAAHIALTSAGTPISCDTCHNGLGGLPSTPDHYNRAKSRVPPGDVAFLATYNAETGASTFLSSALTCTNVSCHGGTTPNWQTGAINVNTACTICHSQGTAQFNSYNSGEHSLHVSLAQCTECHDMTLATAGAQNHFRFLSTSAMEGPAKDTFRNTTGSVVYTPGATAGAGTCTGTCHGKSHSAETW